MENNKRTTLYLSTEGLPFPASQNHYLGYRGVRKGNACMVMAYTKKEAKQFQKAFGAYLDDIIKNTSWDEEVTRDKHYILKAVFYFPKKGMDSENHYKIMNDVLEEKQIIVNDKHLICQTQGVFYDKHNPRIELFLAPAEYTGIFPDDTSLNEFESICHSCTRFLDGRCSLLKGAKEGRVQPEIEMDYINNEGHITHENIRCTKFKEKK